MNHAILFFGLCFAASTYAESIIIPQTFRLRIDHSRCEKIFEAQAKEAVASAAAAPSKPRAIVIASDYQIYSHQWLESKLAESYDSLDSGALVLRSVYQKMLERTGNRHLVSARSAQILDELVVEMPNFIDVINIVRNAIALSVASGEPVHIQPLLLLGAPGIGKTYFAKRLAELIGSSMEVIQMNGVTGGMILAGNSSRWRGSKMGRVSEILIKGDVANPVIVVDEIDKANRSEQDPYGPFYSLLEPDQAKTFYDEYLEMPMDASKVIWIATANDLEAIPDPIRTRLTIVKARNPNFEEMQGIINLIVNQMLRERPRLKFTANIDMDFYKKLSEFSPRDAKLLIRDAMGSAIVHGRDYLLASDINTTLVRPDSNRNGIGFGATLAKTSK